MERTIEDDVNAACENICDGGGTIEEHARLLAKDHNITFERAVRAIEGALEEDPCPDDDGDDRPWGEQQGQIDWLESRFDMPGEEV